MLGGNAGVFIGVDFNDLKLALELAIDVIEYASHHLAGPTPGRIKIHQDRSLSAGQQLIKALELLLSGHGMLLLG
jgi:hypothetical protein